MSTQRVQEPLLQGQEVLLRGLRMEDAEHLASAASESRENYGYNPVPDGVEESKAYIARAHRERDAGDRMPFAVEWNGRVVGTTSYAELRPWQWPQRSPLQRHGRPDVVEIGYTWLAASAQRTRCNTEAKYLLLQHAFETWEVHRVALRTDARNVVSRNAITRLGAQFEGIRRADRPGQDGRIRNSAMFSILLAEWPSVRDRLLQRLE